MEKLNIKPPDHDLVKRLLYNTATKEEREEWNKAFKTYNKDNNAKLGMGCRPCYGKVYLYLKSTNQILID